MKSVNIPGFFILDIAEIEVRKHLHWLFYLRSNIVWRFHYLSESWFNNDRSLRLMVLEDDMTSLQSSPHGRYQHYINVNICHFIFSLQTLHLSLLSNFNIKILVTEFFLGVFLSVRTFINTIFFLKNTSYFVEFGLSMPDEIYHLDLLFYVYITCVGIIQTGIPWVSI